MTRACCCGSPCPPSSVESLTVICEMNWIFFTKKIEWNDRKEPKGERERQRERERAGTEQEKDKYLLPVQAGFVCMPPKPPAGMEMRRKDETYDVSCWNNNRGRCGSWNGNVVFRSRLNGLHYRSTVAGVRIVFFYGA